MTREEAIVILDCERPYGNCGCGANDEEIEEALNMAIKALGQKPCEQIKWERDVALDQLKQLGYGLGEKLRHEDCISRQATIEAFQMFRGYEANRTNAEWVDRIETVVKKLPPITPRSKTGHWINRSWDDVTDRNVECSSCGKWQWGKTNYCPNCGTKMESEG